VLIHAYGLFWRAEEIDWSPGGGRRAGGVRQFGLLGRLGTNAPGLRVADFRAQRGIYILYAELGPYYVGLNEKRDLGLRLKDHRSDLHAGKWDRFSWFGFLRVLERRDGAGLNELSMAAMGRYVEHAKMYRELEALIIRAVALQNRQRTRFPAADSWTQVRRDERPYYLSKVAR
jgi:hypothetical protein